MHGVNVVLYVLPLVIAVLGLLTLMVVINSHFKNKDDERSK